MAVPSVLLETVMIEADIGPVTRRVAELFRTSGLAPFGVKKEVGIPASATRKGVKVEAYDDYRLGLGAACADTVIVKDVDGTPRVPLIRRAQPPFGGTWWIMGGVIFNFRPVEHFLLWKVHRECGLETCAIDEFVQKYDLADDQCSCNGIHMVGYLGFVRTAADDTVDPRKVCDTFNVCGMTVIHGNTQELYHDKDHSAIRWVSMEELTPGSCGHWYPEWAARKALEVYNRALGVEHVIERSLKRNEAMEGMRAIDNAQAQAWGGDVPLHKRIADDLRKAGLVDDS
jgi:ADP-ribose pyrophosphatase YjhB (NUDIX family)